MNRLYKKLMLWYWMRYYKKKLTQEPESAEMLEMAMSSGSLREYNEYVKQRKR